MKDTRIKLDSTYYTLEAIKGLDKFKQLKEKLSKKYNLPLNGFKSVSDYHKWQDKHYSPEVIDEVLRTFNLDSKDEKLQLGLKWILFFNKPPATSSPINYLTTSADNGNIEINLSVLPWATKEDFDRLELWKEVEQIRTTPKTKNKEWETFERDLEVYNLYQKIEIDNPKSAIGSLTEDTRFSEIAEKYDPNNIDASANLAEQVYKIITRCRNTFGKHFSTV